MSDEAEVEAVARAFHESYEEWAREFGWATQEQSRVRWEDLPEANRRTMLATVKDLADYGMVVLGAVRSRRTIRP